MFAPANAEPALTCLDGMEFEGVEKIREEVKNKSIMLQQFNAMQGLIMQLDAANPGMGLAASVGLQTQQAPAQQQTRKRTESATAEERAAKTETDDTRTTKARVKAAKQAAV